MKGSKEEKRAYLTLLCVKIEERMNVRQNKGKVEKNLQLKIKRSGENTDKLKS